TFHHGLAIFANSTYADSWSYVAFADYLMAVLRGTEGGLAPLHQYAAHLIGTRNAGSAILAYLSIGLGGVKPDQAVVLFCLVGLFANVTALVAFAGTLFDGNWRTAGALILLAGVGWPADITLVGNFDHLLLLPLL